MNADGSRARKLGSGRYPMRSPDSARIAYRFDDRLSSRSGFAIVDPATRRTRRIRVGGIADLSWAPSGTTIAYALGSDDRIWLYDLASGTSRLLGRAPARYGIGLTWSPDGALIAVDDDSGIQLLDPSSGRLTTLTSDGAAPVWSPLGDRLAFVRRRPNNDLDLRTIGRDGRDEHRVATLDRGYFVLGGDRGDRYVVVTGRAHARVRKGSYR